MRSALYTLMLFWSCQAIAGTGSDPFGTEAMLPSSPALHDGSTTPIPCDSQLPGHPLSLPDVIDLALCRNPQTRESWINSRVYAAQVGVSKAGYLPSLDLNASANRSQTDAATSINSNSVGLTLSYLLYDFGSRSANLAAAEQLLVAANAARDSTVQAVFLAAVQAFYQVQATLAALDAALESERAAKESFAAAEAHYLAGSSTRADKLQAQTAFSQATLNRITADGDLKNSQGALANMLGMDANRHVPLATTDTTAVPAGFDGNVAALIETARQHRPDLQAAAAQLKASQASADTARAADRPTISLSASANQNHSSGIGSHNAMIGINLNVPIFSGYAPTYRLRAAEAQAEAKSAQLERLRLQVALDVWTAYQNLATATQALRATADLLDSAQQSERVVLGRYKAGVGNMLEVLNAQSALAGARQQRAQSAFNWNISRAILAQAMGNLDTDILQTLSPNPPEQKIQESQSP